MSNKEYFGGRANTNGFDKRPNDINRAGRPKAIYKILKEKGFTAKDIKTAFGELAWYSLPELQKVHQDETKPIILRIVANQLYLALKKGDWGKIREILEHVIGKPNQKIENSGDFIIDFTK